LFTYNKLWANKQPTVGSKLKLYGIGFKIMVIEYVPGISKGPDLSQCDFIPDESSESGEEKADEEKSDETPAPTKVSKKNEESPKKLKKKDSDEEPEKKSRKLKKKDSEEEPDKKSRKKKDSDEEPDKKSRKKKDKRATESDEEVVSTRTKKR
jgi:hypothetical protein